MRRKDGFMLRMIGSEAVVVPLAQQVVNFSAILTLNETGKILWEQLEVDTSLIQLATRLVDEYDVDPGRAEADVSDFVSELSRLGMVE